MVIELGKIYEVRNPKEVLSGYKIAYVQVTGKTENPLKPFLGNNGEQYSALGLVDSLGKPSIHDLVKEIDTNVANPLNIDYTGFESSLHYLPDLRNSFYQDIVSNYKFQVTSYESPLIEDSIEMIVNYALDMMIDYKNKNMDVLPAGIVFSIIDQVKEVVKKTFNFIDDSPYILDDIEKWIKEKLTVPNIETYILYYFKYFLDSDKITTRWKSITATLLKMLNESYSIEGALVTQNALSLRIRQTQGFTPNINDFNESLKAVNSIFGVNKEIIKRYGAKLTPDSEMLITYVTEISRKELFEISLKFQKIM